MKAIPVRVEYRFDDGSVVIADVTFDPHKATRVLARAVRSAINNPEGTRTGTGQQRAIKVKIVSHNEAAAARFRFVSHAGVVHSTPKEVPEEAQ